MQFGFLDMGFQADGIDGGGDSDDDLEAELAALTKGTQPSREKKSKRYDFLQFYLLYMWLVTDIS